MQSALGFSSVNRLRALPALLAWVTLNLRYISINFAFTFNSIKPGDNDYTKPGMLRKLLPFLPCLFLAAYCTARIRAAEPDA